MLPKILIHISALGPSFAIVGFVSDLINGSEEDRKHQELLNEFEKVNRGIHEIKFGIGELGM